MSAKFYRVGGWVRDKILGIESKDIDFAVEAESFDAMRAAILDRGGKIFLENPEFLTIRARDKRLGPVDFVLCRKDGAYSDGRHPDTVEVGTLLDDLARRDFTMNAMAIAEDDSIIDPFNGRRDLERGIIEVVGHEPYKRFEEDSLRLVRAIRFSVTKDLRFSNSCLSCLHNTELAQRLRNVSVERIREELSKAFEHNTLRTLGLLEHFSAIRDACFSSGLKLMPTLKKKFGK